MSLVISTNLNSLVVQNNLAANQPELAQAMQRLSSGMRINSAADDAAGLAIANTLNSQSSGDGVAIQNANNASSLAQIADGALASISNDLQTLRNLAVESANGTNSSTNRAALNIQAQQVIADIQNSATTTNYNGVNLLNGNFTSQFQIGANAGQTINLTINNVQTTTLGAGQGTGITAQGQAGASATPSTSLTAISAGDLVINGTIIPASLSTSDTASYTANDTALVPPGTISSNASASTSAIAKVAAINSVSKQTGVTAIADANVVSGTSMSAPSTTSGSVYINGISISLNVSSSFTNDANRTAEVTAINAYTGQTGVVATNTGSDATGITLTAKDGRNISVDFSTTGSPLTAAATGLIATGTYSGGYTLTTANNKPIEIQQGTGSLSNTGLQAGSYQPGVATVSSTQLTSVTGSTTTTALASGDLVINGVSVNATNSTMDNLSYYNQSGSSVAIAHAINLVSTQTGVNATTNPTLIQGTALATTGAGHTGNLAINGVNTSLITITGVISTDVNNEVNAINAISGQSGVAASINNAGTGLILTAADGRNITLKDSASGTLASTDLGLSATSYAGSTQVTTMGSYTLTSGGPIQVTSITGASHADAGMLEGTYGGTTNGTFLSQLDISTVAGANAALVSTDNALTTINEIRANIGAFQNRMTATVSNLQSQQTNLTSAYTAITGADFAKETANMTRAQVLQQAGIAVLSQANALSQQVLSLLR